MRSFSAIALTKAQFYSWREQNLFTDKVKLPMAAFLAYFSVIGRNFMKKKTKKLSQYSVMTTGKVG